ncbi:restriction endonuclease subunit S [Aeromonas crassostreae]
MARSLAKDSLPAGWKYDLLDKFSTRCSGHTPSKSFPQYWNGGIKWISLADSHRLDQGYVHQTDNEISEAGIANSSAELHPAETVVLSRDAGIGKSGVMAVPMAVSQHFIAWKCDNKEILNSWFLYNWLQLNKAEFERQAVGSTIKTIGLPYFKKLKIAVPPYPEQNKIAQILSTWDKAITTTEQLLANSQQQKKALMQQLLTGKKRLGGYSGAFKRYHFSDLLKIDAKNLGTKIAPDFAFDYISLSDVELGRIGSVLERHVYKNAPSRARRVVKYGDILLSTVRPNLKGFAKISHHHENCIASTGFSVLTPKNGTCGDYIYHCLFSAHITGQINSLVVGTNYPAINSSDVSGLCVYCPCYDEQVKISEILNNCDASIDALQQKRDALKQEKKALMQQLLTGKRRVKVEEAA